jgi:hypothetical protein
MELCAVFMPERIIMQEVPEVDQSQFIFQQYGFLRTYPFQKFQAGIKVERHTAI